MRKSVTKYLERVFDRRKCSGCGKEFETIDLKNYALKIKKGNEFVYFDCYKCMQNYKKTLKNFEKTLDNRCHM